MAKAKKLDLDAEFVKAIFELIHAQAVKRQSTGWPSPLHD
jgi:hypothetical protein